MKFKVASIKFPQMNFLAKPQFYIDFDSGKDIQLSTEILVEAEVGNNDIYSVTETIKTATADKNLELQVVCVGSFVFEEIEDHDALEYALNVNCCALLFPFLREKVAYIMGAAGVPPLYMDSFNFIQRYKDLKQKKAEA